MSKTRRYGFIDDMRGLVVVMMALGHSSYYFHSMWKSLDYTDPFFDNLSQFLIRFQGYLCAPGFLILAGAMVWLSFFRSRARGLSAGAIRMKFIKRGLFLILVQMTWVNASWSGFRSFRLFHMGIISCIGISVILLSLIVAFRWQMRLAIGMAITAALPVLINIPYDMDHTLQQALAQTWVDAGKFNVYPVLPWFALAALGSVIGEAWFVRWKEKAALYTLAVAVAALLLGTMLRVREGYGTTFSCDAVGTYSFYLIQKYPPNVVHNLWAFGGINLWMSFLVGVGPRIEGLLRPLKVYGSVPLFFYMLHIPILAIFAKRLGFFYRQGGTGAVFLGWIGLLLIMYPLCKAYGALRSRTTNPIVRML